MDEFTYDSPIGPLTLRLRDGVLAWVGFDGTGAPALPAGRVRDWLDTFFAGRPPPDIPLALDVTPFQRAVLEATSAIPRGEVRTYGWVAARVGRPRGARAVGQALGANPVPLVIPATGWSGPGGTGGTSAGWTARSTC